MWLQLETSLRMGKWAPLASSLAVLAVPAVLADSIV